MPLDPDVCNHSAQWGHAIPAWWRWRPACPCCRSSPSTSSDTSETPAAYTQPASSANNTAQQCWPTAAEKTRDATSFNCNKWRVLYTRRWLVALSSNREPRGQVPIGIDPGGMGLQKYGTERTLTLMPPKFLLVVRIWYCDTKLNAKSSESDRASNSEPRRKLGGSRVGSGVSNENCIRVRFNTTVRA